MTREEIKEMILNDADQQFKTTVAAQITVLYEYFIKKEIFTNAEIDEMNKLTDEYVEKLNNIAVNAAMEKLSMEEENE